MCLSTPKAPPPPPPQPKPVTMVEPQQYSNTSPEFEMGLEAELTPAQLAAQKKMGKNKLKLNPKKDAGVQTGGLSGTTGTSGGGSGVNINN